MPGPGGRGRSGGFGGGSRGGSRGGFSGGSRGSFGGGMHRPTVHHHRPYVHHTPYYGGWGRRTTYGGGGCGGCLSSVGAIIMLPIILIIVLGSVAMSNVDSSIVDVSPEPGIYYDEATFQDYAFSQYNKEFTDSATYEDNLLIVFLANEAADGYYTIAFVGDNLQNEVAELFGNEYTAFGDAMLSNISDEYYAYSLSSSLAYVMNKMTDEVTNLNLESSFKTDADRTNAITSHLTNYTSLSVSEATVNPALLSFTEKTGIPAVIVVDYMENVFEVVTESEELSTTAGFRIGIVPIMIIVIAVVVIIYVIISIKKNDKNGTPKRNNEPPMQDEHRDYDPEIK